MPPAARKTDTHACAIHPPNQIVAPCAPTVLIGNLPAARVTDITTCSAPIVTGSPTVLIGNLLAARIGDKTAHGGVIVTGWPTVIICDGTSSGGSAHGTCMLAAKNASASFISKSKNADPPVKTGMGYEVDQLVSKSSSLQKDLKQLQQDGWGIKYGPNGSGSITDREAKIIQIDGAHKDNANLITQTLAHEVGHATYSGKPDYTSRDTYVKSTLKDEGAATLNNIRVQREILANGGPNIGIAGNSENSSKYEAAYDRFLKNGDSEKATETIGTIFGNGEITSNTRQPYEAYYGDFYDQNYGKSKGHP